ncbi:hypothetical protein [Paenibacillus sp. HB172176]|uniref:hypothetical protein n=1 Tax=Paenibacillus sp. HB172176 TaxID=2493690 RepID=UPI00143C3A14|nr:hypothetical protein [Paenibacillus sp. HB172176]
MPTNKYSAGIILLIVGVIILLGKIGVFSVLGAIFWPLLVLIPGVLLQVLYFGRVVPAVTLVPGGMLVVYALLFIICNIFGWESLRILWPLFFFGVAAGLYEYYMFGSAVPRVIFRVSVGLAAASLLVLVIMLMWSWGIYLVAAALIAAGAWMMFGKRKRW